MHPFTFIMTIAKFCSNVAIICLSTLYLWGSAHFCALARGCKSRCRSLKIWLKLVVWAMICEHTNISLILEPSNGPPNLTELYSWVPPAAESNTTTDSKQYLFTLTLAAEMYPEYAFLSLFVVVVVVKIIETTKFYGYLSPPLLLPLPLPLVLKSVVCKFYCY